MNRVEQLSLKQAVESLGYMLRVTALGYMVDLFIALEAKKQCPLVMTWLLHSGTHSSYGYLCKTKPFNIPSLAPPLVGTWRLRRKDSGRPPMLQEHGLTLMHINIRHSGFQKENSWVREMARDVWMALEEEGVDVIKLPCRHV